MLKFTAPVITEKETLKKLSAITPEGTQAFAFLSVNENIPEGAFFCGRDENDMIRSLVFNDGDGYIKVYGSEFSPIFSFSEKCLMIYDSPRTPEGEVREICGKELLDFYKLISQSEKLSFDNEKRYVDRVKAVNRGFAKVFAIYENGKIISAAAVSAVNEKYALISDVFTHPDHRSKGCAARCINACIQFILSLDKTPFLRCEEKMCPYYEKLGFVYYGKM